MIMEEILSPTLPVRCIFIGPSEWSKSVFLADLILKIIIEYNKKDIHSRIFHQNFYQNLFKCFSIYIPSHIIPSFLHEEDIDIINDGTNNDKGFQKSDTEKETYESKEQGKKWHSESADPAKAFGPSDILDRNPIVEIHYLLFSIQQ